MSAHHNDLSAATDGHNFTLLQRRMHLVKALDRKGRLGSRGGTVVLLIITPERQEQQAPIFRHDIEALTGKHTVGLEVIEINAKCSVCEVNTTAYLRVGRTRSAARHLDFLSTFQNGAGRKLVCVEVWRQQLAVQSANDTRRHTAAAN
jgi:hypothetical protein